MGTNYYATVGGDPCKTCGHDPDACEYHIGKSSMGWVFSLHVEPDDPDHPHTWAQWLKLLEQPGTTIEDEYGAPWTLEEFRSTVEKRERAQGWETKPYGYNSWHDFHQANGSMEGPKGLLRGQLSSHVAAHGEGTWDLVTGSFS